LEKITVGKIEHFEGLQEKIENDCTKRRYWGRRVAIQGEGAGTNGLVGDRSVVKKKFIILCISKRSW